MSTTYQEVLNQVLNQVQHLQPDDQLRLLEDLTTLVHQQYAVRPKHRITEFKGLGKEVWRKIDVEKYIEEERNSWER
jgi:hypothetical protein